MEPKNSYLFYDIETTGLNKCFDQILQFAAIRTDLDLNEMERHEIHIRLNPDVVPSPYAVMTHRIGPDQFNFGDCEYQAIQKIHALLNTPGTTSVGYNTLGFDDEFLRFSFYRNLLPPYTHQYANRCGRMDLYPMALLYYLFKSEGLIWPEDNLKLENINALNQLAQGQAHNAMTDVEATLALAKKFFQNHATWSFATGYFDKKIDESRIQKTDHVLYIDNLSYPIGLLLFGKIGKKDNYTAPVLLLGTHKHYKNQSIFLRLDTSDLIKTNSENISDTTRSIKKRLGEPPLFLPLKDRYRHLISSERLYLLDENQTFLAKNPTLFYQIKHYYLNDTYPEFPERDIDAALYTIGFPTPAEEKLFREFHTSKPEEKLSIAKNFSDPFRYEQAMRIIARNFPGLVTTSSSVTNMRSSSAKAEDPHSKTPIDFRGEKKYTLAQAKIDLAAIEQKGNLDAEQRTLLSALKDFYQGS